ncbi:MAG: DUF924 domain-containing protein [Rhizobiales bacterium]|nr:DUF924 domain-containing protein [Hyphomicrobiales bacterium]
MNRISDINTRVIEFWRAAGKKNWFAKSDSFDAKIKTNFLADVEYLADIDLVTHFKGIKNAMDVLGIIICLDQFRRNLYRNSAKAFEQDAKALGLAKLIQTNGLDDTLDEDIRTFAYMPYMHCEQLVDQETSLKLFDNSNYAVIHYDLIIFRVQFPAPWGVECSHEQIYS